MKPFHRQRVRAKIKAMPTAAYKPNRNGLIYALVCVRVRACVCVCVCVYSLKDAKLTFYSELWPGFYLISTN